MLTTCLQKLPFGRSACIIILTIAGILINNSNADAQGTWTKVTNTAPDYNGGVMLLLTDGSVIAKTWYGGYGSTPGSTWDKLTPDAHGSYVNGAWSTITPMDRDRLYFSSWVLNDGRVYVGGGEYGFGDSAEVYNPVTNAWAAAPAPGVNFSDGGSEMLPNGNLLLAVNSGTTLTNYIYNPTTNNFTAGPSCIASHDETSWLKLADSSILQIDFNTTTAERYIPSLNAWVADATVPVAIFDPYATEEGAAILLPDGRGFFMGATGHTAFYTPSGTASPGAWAAGPDMPGGQSTPDGPAAMMANGKLLVMMSAKPTSSSFYSRSISFYEFDYTTDSFTQVNAPAGGLTMSIPTYFTNLLALPDGNILFCDLADMNYYVYTPGGTAITAGKPTIDSIMKQGCDTFKMTGKLFTGISEGAAYGDDWAMASNYPIVRLTAGSGVYYARTCNWNRPGAVRTGMLADTTTFVVPIGLPAGTYTAQVIVNGNASDGVSLTIPPGISPATNSICQGTTTTLADSLGSGVWSSSNAAVASVGSSSGVVTGVASGAVNISCTVSGCTSISTITINALPVISGTANVCAGSSITLTGSPASGVWASGNVSKASVGTASGIVSGVAAGTAIISYTASGCTSTMPFTVNSTPSAISGTTAICTAASTTLHTSPSGGTWSSGNTSLATVGVSSGLVRGVAAGVAPISYILATGCYSVQQQTINTTPSAITGGTTVCLGTTLTLNSSPSGGTWSSSNLLVSTIDAALGLVSGLLTGTSTMTYSLSDGCSVSKTVSVILSPVSITGSSTACTGATTTLNDATTGGTWTSGTTGKATIGSATGIVTGVSAGTAKITYTIAGGCKSTTTITVNASPAAITGGNSVCAGASLTLHDAASGGSWSSGGTSVATIGTAGSVTGVNAGATDITYLMATGCSAIQPFTVNALPAPVSGTMSVCSGASTTLTDVTADGSWTSSAPSIATVNSATGIVTALSSGTTTITYSTTSCGNATAVVSVNATASAITGANAVCAGSTTTLGDATTGGTWSSSNTSIATVGAASGIVTGVSAGAATITYTTGSCGFATQPVIVNVAPTSISGTLSVCTGSTTSLTDASSGGYWISSNTSIAGVDSFSGTATGISLGNATISYSTACGIAAATVSVNSTPAAITGALNICSGSSVTLSDASAGGVWSSGSTVVATIGSSSGSVNGLSNGTATITYNAGSCGYATATVSVSPAPSAISGPTVLCSGTNASYTDSVSGGTWSSSNTTVATIGGGGVLNGVAGGIATISYNTGCASVATSLVTVNATPSAGVISGSTDVCVGSTITLTNTASGGVWSAANAIVSAGSVSGVITGVAAGSDTVRYIVSTAYCSASTAINVHVDLPVGNIYTYGGTGTSGYAGDGTPAFTATIATPRAVAVDASGNVYVCDVPKNVVRKISANGVICTFAGTGVAGNTGDGGQATAATLSGANGVYADAAGNVLICNTGSSTIRKVSPSGVITTVAGTGVGGYSGDGIQATAAKIYSPLGVCEDASGNIYIADQNNYRVRKVDAVTGIISTIVGYGSNGYDGDGGQGTAARISYSRDVQADNAGNLYIADCGNDVIRKYVISTGIITTIAGVGGAVGFSGDGGQATAAVFNTPARLTFDGGNILFVADQVNQRIRQINLRTGIISTFAGAGTAGFSGDAGAPMAAKLNMPSGIAYGPGGRLFVADALNSRVRVASAGGTIAIRLSGSTTVPAGTPVTFTTTSMTAGALQWQKNGTNVGAGLSTYIDSIPTTGDTYSCLLDVSPECSSAYSDTSNSITITVAGGRHEDEVSRVNDANNGVTLYPNPTHDIFNIAASGWPSGITTIVITDQLGREACKTSCEAVNNQLLTQLNSQTFPPGIYIVSITDALGRVAKLKCVRN